jgi:FHS family glucose/mannose:H+ symporter-like MFS transporter
MSFFKKNDGRVIFLAYGALLSLGFLDNLRGAVFESLTLDLGLSDARAALFFAVPSTVAFLASYFSQSWIERYGPILTIRIGLLIMTGAYFLFSLPQTFNFLLLETVLFGFGFGLVSVAQNIAISAAAHPDFRRQLLSGLHAMYGLASLLSPLLAQVLFFYEYTWREIFAVAVTVPIVIFASSCLLQFHPWTQLEKINSTEMNFPPRRGHGLFFSISMSLYLIAEISVSSRLVVFVRRELGLSESEAPLYLAAFFLCLFVSRLFFAVVRLKALRTVWLLQSSLLSSATMIGLGLTVSSWFLALAGLTLAPFFPAALDYVASTFGAESHRVMAYCVAFASLTTVLMHYGVGVLSDLYGIDRALWMGPIALVAVSLLLVIERRLFSVTS